MRIDTGFRQDVRDCAPACRTLSDREVRAFGVALLAEMSRRDGVAETAAWARLQAERLASMDASTAA